MTDPSEYEWHAVSDRGLVRQKNEDYVVADGKIGVFVLADGMGGHRGGEVASEIAAKTVLKHLQSKVPELLPGELDERVGYTGESVAAREAVIKANQEIYQTAQTQPQYEGMGTTLVVVAFYLDRMSVAHVGDSRLYRFRQGQLAQLTSDHTMRQELIDRGFYTENEAGNMIQRNLVTRALGVDTSVAVDVREDLVLPDDFYLMCSDGLYDMLDDEMIAAVIKEENSTENCAHKLVNMANSSGGKDNISVICIRKKSGHRTHNNNWIHRLLRRNR
ncbi:Stp1/IreP family PP2C-type Ser/Thr phosphatase [Acidihalobacter ferrooxydans]|uniref:PPM-type phosphatase domain-containing protein n=1 Tax=Acidihalobacter ferrooxydans TaxID=1765967 RepID=A0A1P8UEH0_9GAMM|nr:Stp1/IreP family PP2C-type Ser/Thr phosphatase [Acidihalobacter ferrooxydans]APZ42220.1 hypothetical protein BW247_03195 [Acidihalobacter ferrooxydans]